MLKGLIPIHQMTLIFGLDCSISVKDLEGQSEWRLQTEGQGSSDRRTPVPQLDHINSIREPAEEGKLFVFFNLCDSVPLISISTNLPQ